MPPKIAKAAPVEEVPVRVLVRCRPHSESEAGKCILEMAAGQVKVWTSASAMPVQNEKATN